MLGIIGGAESGHTAIPIMRGGFVLEVVYA